MRHAASPRGGSDERPTLCMVVHGPYPIGEERVMRSAQAALAEGYAVDVVAMRRPGDPRLEWIEGVRTIRLPLTHHFGGGLGRVVFEYTGFTLLALGAVALLAPRYRYDVVHVHNPPDFLIAAGVVPKLLGAHLIFDIHDLAPDMFAMRFQEKRLGVVSERLLRLVERIATRLADDVITVHEPYKEELMLRGVPAEKITVVMNSLDERLLPEPERKQGAGGFRVVYHGTLTPHYGVELLVDAFASLAREVPDTTLDIYGEGDSVGAIRSRARRLGIEERVHVGGEWLPQREMLARVNGAAVGVIPNLPIRLNRFALSSKLFEYVALGIPVVSARLQTIERHFADDEVLYFEPGDSESMGRALLEVAKHPEAARARAAAARRRYESYRWQASASRYARVLEQARRT